MKRILLLLLCCWFCAGSASGQWTRTSGPTGGVIIDLATINSTIFAATANDGVYRSTNGGATWTSASAGLPATGFINDLEASGTMLFAATSEGVYRSLDNGANWSLANTGLPDLVATIAATGSTLYAGLFSSAVYRSVDNGLNWVSAGNAGLPMLGFVASIAASGTHLFALHYDAAFTPAIYRSVNGGANWALAATGLPVNLFPQELITNGTGFLLTVFDAPSLYRWNDTLTIWEPDATPIFEALASGSTFYGINSTGTTIYSSNNNGATWATAATTTNTIAALNDLVLSGTTYVVGTFEAGIFRLPEGATMWEPGNSGLRASVVGGLASIGTSVFANTGIGGLHRSLDQGTNWSPIGETIEAIGFINDLEVSGTQLLAGTGLGFFRSPSQGATWTANNTGLPAAATVFDLVFGGATLFAALGEDGVYRSTDVGNMWAPALNGLPVPEVVYLLAANGSTVFAATTAGLYRSTNSGDTWALSDTGLPEDAFISALAVKGTTVFAATDSGVYRSTNNGDAWSLANTGFQISFVDAFLIIGSTIYAGTPGGGVYQSADDGGMWTTVNTGLTNLSVRSLGSVGTRLLAGTDGSGVFALELGSGCTYTIAPTSRNYSATGGTGMIAVTTAGGCVWTATSNDGWIQVTLISNGTGSGTVSFNVSPNFGTERAGTIAVAGQTFTVRQGANFADVPANSFFHEFIGKLSAVGITTGCGTDVQGNPIFCPTQTVTREQMAAFLMRALGEFNPPLPAQQRFVDVPPANFFYAFIDRLATVGVTTGCNAPQFTQYCPGGVVTREQMAAFIMRALGEFNPPPPSMQRFEDVPPANFFYPFIDRMAVLGITTGCNAPQFTQYCPGSFVTREQMAAFLVRAFGL